MCVYCKETPACDHERDACAASRGERCIECGHGSTAFLTYTPVPGRFNSWPPSGQWPKRTLRKKATQAPGEKATKRAKT